MLSDAVTVIRWEAVHDDLLDRAEDEFVHVLAGSLGAALARLERTEPELARDVLNRATDAAVLRSVLLAPETSGRLLWAGAGAQSDRELGTFLAVALALEAAHRAGAPPDLAERELGGGRCWTALGDSCFDVLSGTWSEQPALAGLTLDAMSPGVSRLDGDLRIGSGLHPYTDPGERVSALCKVDAAMRALDLLGGPIAPFVRRFTLVANVVTDPEIDRFSSGSTNQHVGRSILWNAHLPNVDVATVAEALVHEAVHSLLYMKEACRPWLRRHDDLPPAADQIVSPWSGATLRLESFLQACFVWYALVHFWRAAGCSPPFSAERVRRGLATARTGFLQGPLAGRIASGPSLVAPDVLELIQAMQTEIAGGPVRSVHDLDGFVPGGRE